MSKQRVRGTILQNMYHDCNKNNGSVSVSLFNGISTLVGYLMPKPSLLKYNSGIT